MLRYLILIFFSFPALSDVMNLNNDMPTHLEDATPIDEHTFDLQYSLALEKGDQDELRHRPNFRYGISKDLQFETEATIFSGGKEDYSGQTDMGLLYRLNHSKNLIPELSISPVAIFPTGKGMDSMLYSVRINLTTTLIGTSEKPDFQIHFNYQFEHNDSADAMERTDRNIYTFGMSQRILEGTALVVDAFLEEQHEKGENVYLIEAGLHHNLGNNYFIGVSFGTGLGSSVADSQGLLAFEKQFD
ncbi:hypothetical protein [Peredibacter starrii]|uniref:MetA-pathway of phenol degradation n=1 Tax=Peredibacter starrii TaxID=28202 RepID=A0AAX4HVB7_9BACT|nr:hypothetical protein [Peredibacter starrii]WPU67196.1 hypothetical protein SOO65_10560 [Peredibacter starrii]